VLHAIHDPESRALARSLTITGELRTELAKLFGRDNVWEDVA